MTRRLEGSNPSEASPRLHNNSLNYVNVRPIQKSLICERVKAETSESISRSEDAITFKETKGRPQAAE